MKMNKLRTFATICTVCLLMSIASCSSYIPIQIAVPARKDLGRGSKISITSSGEYADLVLVKFKDLVINDGYYTVVPQHQADYKLRFIQLRDKYGNRMDGVNYYITVDKYNVATQRQCIETVLDRNEYGGLFSSDPPRDVAKRCYNYIAPHEATIKIYQCPKAKTEELKMAVEMCKNNQWYKALKLILEAKDKYPDDPENYYMLAIVAVTRSKYDASDVFLKKAYSMKPDKRYKQAMENNAAMRKNDAAVIQQLSGQQD